MKKTELEKCPKWLLDANTCDENVEWGNGTGSWIIWHGGVWQGGDWHGGAWQGGDWHGGDWHGGVWQGGDWHGGVWHGGAWHGGVWHGGASSIRSKYTPTMLENGKLKIGCKDKTITEWDSWFKGKEEFSTKRGTVEFQMIHAHFLAAKAYFNHMERAKRKASK